MAHSTDLTASCIPDVLSFAEGPGGPIAEVNTAFAKARVSLFGGQVLSFQPAGAKPVLWLSDAAAFDGQQAIRGGVPICWPWFGPRPGQPAWPSHGFARNRAWRLEETRHAAGAVALTLSLPKTEADFELWPYESRPRLVISVGNTLRLALTVDNSDAVPISFGQALHSYFAVEDVEAVEVRGLEQSAYLDQLDAAAARKPPENAPIRIDAELDRVYELAQGPLVIDDARRRRRISIDHDGAKNAIVWNPWQRKSSQMNDMGAPGAFRSMVCVETGNVGVNAIHLPPGASHTLTTEIRVSKSP